MLTQDTLLRLSQLTRTQSEFALPQSLAAPPTAGPLATQAADEQDDVSQLPAGGREVVNGWGRHWQRDRGLDEVWTHGEQWLSRAAVRHDPLSSGRQRRASELQALLDHLPGRVLLLDLETCGFAGSPVFLVGLLHEQCGRWMLSQLLARNYAEEKPMLQSLWSLAAGKCVLVTFNGKSFDWPMVHDRSTVHHLGQDRRDAADEAGPAGSAKWTDSAAPLQSHDRRPELIHCDLLHHARRRWGQRLPDCRLQTLERHICRRQRADDIPGREIPAAYQDFVRHGDAWLMRGVLHHNALDLVTLLQLATLVTS